jgi:VWFA-related protein
MHKFRRSILSPPPNRSTRRIRGFWNLALLGVFGFLVLWLRAQEPQQYAGVVNVEVPVRVFDGERFVDNLTLSDFEVFENGKPQKIVALYLVRKTNVQKEETSGPAAVRPAPKTHRMILMQFEVLEPMPKLDEAIDYFFSEVLQAGDSLTIVTPRAQYRFKPEGLARLPRSEIARQLQDRLRTDILAGATDYKRLLDHIRDLRQMSLDPDQKVGLLNEYVRQLRDRIGIDPASLQKVAQALKTLEGQKYVFLFYERELIQSFSSGNFSDESLPPEERFLDDMSAGEVFRSPGVDPKMVEKVFSDASITANFIYLTQSKMNAAGLDAEFQRSGDGQEVKDLSASIFNVFRKMAQATGGISEASGNPFAAFRKAATAAENYYLLYYAPANYQADGTFKEIKVTVRGKNFRVSNRAGYFAK